MKRFTILVATCISIAVPARVVSMPGVAAAAPVRPMSASGTVLFRGAFVKNHLDGWSVASGHSWHVNKSGVAAFPGGDGVMLAPFSTAGRRDFSVQASIRAGGSSQIESGYGILVRAEGVRGVEGGSFASSSGPAFNRPLIAWDHNTVGGADVPLGSGYNTYRLDVHGSDFTLYVDGKQIVQFTVADYGDPNAYAHIGLWSASRAVQVRSFTVRSLSAATPLPPRPPVETINLAPTDVPNGLTNSDGRYYTNAELASLQKVSLETLNASGLRLSYQADFASGSPPPSGPYGVFSYVYAYDNAHSAEAAVARGWPYFRDEFSGPSSVTDNLRGLGDDAHVVSVDYTETAFGDNTLGTLVAIVFRRGPYEATLFEDFVREGMSRAEMVAATTSLAEIIDFHIQGAPSRTQPVQGPVQPGS